MSVSEAARRYNVSQRTLQGRVRLGEIAGCELRGPHGREWRVEAAEMEAFGYRLPEQQHPAPDNNDDGADLPKTIARLIRELAHYRREADEVHGQLGEAARQNPELRDDARRQSATSSALHIEEIGQATAVNLTVRSRQDRSWTFTRPNSQRRQC
jgi:hypothetical protein